MSDGTLGAVDVCAVVGITARQLDAFVRRNIVAPKHGDRWGVAQLRYVAAARDLAALGCPPRTMRLAIASMRPYGAHELIGVCVYLDGTTSAYESRVPHWRIWLRRYEWQPTTGMTRPPTVPPARRTVSVP